MKTIFEKYFPLFNWMVFRNGILMIEDPRKLFTEEHMTYFVEKQGTAQGSIIEFRCKNNYRIIGTRSNFYNKVLQEVEATQPKKK